MPSASIKKEIPCSKEDLIKMVMDIEKYPEFIPWCLNGKIHTTNDKGNKIEIIAELTIGKNFFNETYKSFVIYEKSSDTINVSNIDGPLKHLENKWHFKEKNKITEVSFQVDFELKNDFLNILMTKSFQFVLDKIADAFEKRAEDLFSKT